MIKLVFSISPKFSKVEYLSDLNIKASVYIELIDGSFELVRIYEYPMSLCSHLVRDLKADCVYDKITFSHNNIERSIKLHTRSLNNIAKQIMVDFNDD